MPIYFTAVKSLPIAEPSEHLRALPRVSLTLAIKAIAPARIFSHRLRPAPEQKPEETAVVSVIFDRILGRGLARDEAALRLVAQHHDEFGAVIGFAAEWLVRDDDRGSRQCGRSDAIQHFLRNGDAVERALRVVGAIDRDR